MARTKGKTKRSRRLSVVHRDAAGIEIGAQSHVVAVGPERDPEPVRTFSTFTNDLPRLADWLVAVRITTVAMESTSVFWIPVFEILEERGIEVIVVNARDAKSVPGRKSDVNDAQWIQQLHQYGLLRGSFRPPRDIAILRASPGLRRGPYSAHAEGANADESSAPARRLRHYRGHGAAHHQGDCLGDERSGGACELSRSPLQILTADYPRGACWQLPARACVCSETSAGTLGFLPSPCGSV